MTRNCRDPLLKNIMQPHVFSLKALPYRLKPWYYYQRYGDWPCKRSSGVRVDEDSTEVEEGQQGTPHKMQDVEVENPPADMWEEVGDPSLAIAIKPVGCVQAQVWKRNPCGCFSAGTGPVRHGCQQRRAPQVSVSQRVTETVTVAFTLSLMFECPLQLVIPGSTECETVMEVLLRSVERIVPSTYSGSSGGKRCYYPSARPCFVPFARLVFYLVCVLVQVLLSISSVFFFLDTCGKWGQ